MHGLEFTAIANINKADVAAFNPSFFRTITSDDLDGVSTRIHSQSDQKTPAISSLQLL